MFSCLGSTCVPKRLIASPCNAFIIRAYKLSGCSVRVEYATHFLAVHICAKYTFSVVRGPASSSMAQSWAETNCTILFEHDGHIHKQSYCKGLTCLLMTRQLVCSLMSRMQYRCCETLIAFLMRRLRSALILLASSCCMN